MQVTSGEVNRDRLVSTAGTLISLLAVNEFEVVHNLTSGRYLSTVDFQRGLKRLDGQLISTPAVEFRSAVFTPVVAPAKSYKVVLGLWTERGRSSVGLELQLVLDDSMGFDFFNTAVLGFVEVEPLNPTSLIEPEPAPGQHRNPPPVEHSDSVPERWRPLLTRLANRLASRDYAGLESDGLVLNIDQPSHVGVGYFIDRYPYQIVKLPPEAWLHSEHWLEEEDPHGGCGTIVDLWTAEEGRSDLSMVARVWDDGSTVTAKIEIVHVP